MKLGAFYFHLVAMSGPRRKHSRDDPKVPSTSQNLTGTDSDSAAKKQQISKNRSENVYIDSASDLHVLQVGVRVQGSFSESSVVFYCLRWFGLMKVCTHI